MGMPRFAELASEALIEEIEGLRHAAFEQEPDDDEEDGGGGHGPHRGDQQRGGENLLEPGLAQGLEEQRRAGHEEGQPAEDLAGVLAQDAPPANEHSHQDDAPDDEEARKDA